MTHIVRAVRAEDWPQARELRLAALRDAIAPLAFLESHDEAAARPDAFWQARTARAARGVDAKQFVAERPDGRWLGTLTVLVERPGAVAAFGEPPRFPQTQLVGVYVRPEARGAGIARELLEAGAAWSWALREPRVERIRLHVHEDNVRAEAVYRGAGFTRTGSCVPVPGDDTRREYELDLPRP